MCELRWHLAARGLVLPNGASRFALIMTVADPSLPDPGPSGARTPGRRVRDSRLFAKVGYVRAVFGAMSPAERRTRLKSWALKPNLARRIRLFVFPSKPRAVDGPRHANRRSHRSSHILTAASWVDARQRNLDETKRILDAVGISFTEIDDTSPFRSQVGVALSNKRRVIEAFKEFGDHGSVLVGGNTTIVKGASSMMDRLHAGRIELSPSLILCHYSSPGPDARKFGLECGTVISFWAPQVDEEERPVLYGSARNKWSRVAPISNDHSGLDAALPGGLRGGRHIDDIAFPIDLVCFWVDGADPKWNERRRERLAASHAGATVSTEANEERLYRNRDELRYALRSIQQFAPFLRHVYLITDQQVPEWLDTSAPGLTIVDHSDIFPAPALPVFNSNAIDTRVHYIEGLADHFLVSNDDIMFYGPVTPSDFFTRSGAARLFLSEARIPLGDVLPGEPAVDSAAKNNRRLIEDHFGVTITHKFKHIMIAQNRSVRCRVEETFRDAVEATTLHPFRSIDDLAFSHLCAYSGLITGESIVGNLSYDYVSLGDPRLAERLDALQNNRKIRVLCLNDGDSSVVTDEHGRPVGEIVVDRDARDRAVASFLDAMFPAPSTWERQTPGMSAQSASLTQLPRDKVDS